jgi:hypothetical protein
VDYANEPYVRLYTRDTATWAHLKWEARAVFPSLMRKLERHGTYDLGRWGFQGLASVIRMPEDVTVTGVTNLIEEGVVVQNGSVLMVPNFLEAQSAQRPLSNAERQAAFKERKKQALLRARQDDLPGLSPPEEVTKSNGDRYRKQISPSAVPVPVPVPIQGESLRGGHEAETAEGAKPPPGPPNKRSARSSKKRRALPSREELLELVAEDVIRLRAELHVEPLEAVDGFLGHPRRGRIGDVRAAFRDWVRTRVRLGILTKTNGHATMSPPKKPREKETPLDVEASAAAARSLLDSVEKIGGTT